MRNICKTLVLSLLVMPIGIFANAQQHNEQVTVEGSYRPQIKRSERLVKMPEIKGNDYSIPDLKAQTKDFDYGYDMEMETMSALQYKPTAAFDSDGNFLKAAFGTRVSPVLVFHHYSDLSKTMSLKIGVDHYSTWLDQKDYKKSTFMNNGVNMMTTNKFKSGQLNVFADYHYDMYHLRAYNDYEGNAVTNKNGRNIHSVKAGAKWTASGTSYRQLYQEYSGDYRFTSICGGTTEHQANVKAHFAYSDNWFGAKNVDNLQAINADLKVNYDYLYKSLFMIALNPTFRMSGSFFNVSLGFGVDMKTDDKVGVYPDVKGSFFLLEKNLELYAKAGGHSKINTFESIVKENPFVTTNFDYLSDFGYEKTNIDLGFGAKANIINMIDVNVGARYRIIKNGLFYIPDFDFNVVYDKDATNYHLQAFDVIFMNYNVWNIAADIDCKITADANVGISMAFNSYSIPFPWYKPSFELMLDGGYHLNESWKFNASMLVMGKRWAMNEYAEEVLLKPAFDIKLGADYQLNKDLAAFAEIHNLIHNKYQLYYNYPSMGFELFLGVKYKF